MLEKNFKHIPVLLYEVLNGLKINPNGIYVDATVGGAGHSLKIAKKLTNGKIFAFDKDPDAVFVAKKRLENYNVEIFNEDFSEIDKILKNKLDKKIDGILMDLGVSSFQLDDEKRGFSYKKNCILDMRMKKTGICAKEILNNWSEKDLFFILKNYGEEKFAKKIVEKIILKRKSGLIETTKDFEQIIKSAIPFKFKRKKNPCKKSFQAVRIAVNNELFSLKKGLKACFSLLKPKGRLLVISFHSLEDKIVKNFFKEKSKSCVCPKEAFFCSCNHKKQANILTKKPIVPTEKEIEKNNRARSAKLRILEKI